jgi:chromosome segregation ATPase
MIKNSMYVGGGIVLLLGLLFGSEAVSYARTAFNKTREAVKSNISVEFQLDRARQLIKDLDPEIRRNLHKIAKEEVSIEELRKQREDLENRLSKSEKEILQLNTDLQRGDSTYVYSGKSFNGEQVRNSLESRFTRHKTMKNTSEQLEQILARREQGLAAAQEKLRIMQAERQQLDVQVANLEARLAMVKVAQTASHFSNFDDSALARAREVIKDIDTRIGVDERLTNAETVPVGEINLDDQSKRDISEEISQYFGDKSASGLAVNE